MIRVRHRLRAAIELSLITLDAASEYLKQDQNSMFKATRMLLKRNIHKEIQSPSLVLRMIMLNEIMRVNMSYKPEGPVE